MDAALRTDKTHRLDRWVGRLYWFPAWFGAKFQKDKLSKVAKFQKGKMSFRKEKR